MNKINYGMSLWAVLGKISECGDIGVVKEDDEQYFFALVDVLGHGAEARKLALIIESYLIDHYTSDLVTLINGLHKKIIGSRGAVATICRLNKENSELSYVGIGNITVRILGVKSVRLVSKDGVIGYRTIRPQLQKVKLCPKDILLLHSDGIREHFDVYECKSLWTATPQSIAKEIMDKFKKNDDDASCIVFKYLK